MKERIVQIILKGLVILMICLSFFLLIFLLKKGVLPFINNGQNLKYFLTGQSFFENNNYAIGFLIINTLYITCLSCILIFPTSFFLAVYIVAQLSNKSKERILSFLETLQGIPSMIFGVIGCIFLSKLIYNFLLHFSIFTKGGIGILSSIIVLFLMCVPNCTLLIYQGFNLVENELVEASLALGIDKVKTYIFIVSRKIKESLINSLSFIIIRILSESTVLSMIIGNRTKGVEFNIFETSSTLSSIMLIGLKESSGLNYEIRFSIALVIVILIILINYGLIFIKGKQKNE